MSLSRAVTIACHGPDDKKLNDRPFLFVCKWPQIS